MKNDAPWFDSHGRIQWIESIFISGIRVPPSTFVMMMFLLVLRLKEQFLRCKVDRTQTQTIFNGAICSVDDFYILLHDITQSICLGGMAKRKAMLYDIFPSTSAACEH